MAVHFQLQDLTAMPLFRVLYSDLLRRLEITFETSRIVNVNSAPNVAPAVSPTEQSNFTPGA